jgi:hypothetical protein
MLRQMCESGGMVQATNVIVAAEYRERLLAIIGDRNRPLKHVQRMKVIIFSDERLSGRGEVTRRAGVSRLAVWRWRQRYGGLWCKPSESMKRTLGIIARLRRRELHSRLLAPYCR